MQPDLLICYDTETTSPKPQSCRVVQLGVIAYKDEGAHITEEVIANEVCDPGLGEGYECTPEATAIHGITEEQMRGARRDTEVMREFYDAVQPEIANVIFAGHAISRFDLPILYNVAEREPFVNARYVDTLILAQRFVSTADNAKLGTLIEHLGLGSTEEAHDAVGDCRMVFRLVQYFSKALCKSWAELATDCATPRVHSICGFGKHKGKHWGRIDGVDCVPWWYVKWMHQNFDDASPDMIVTLWHHYGLRMKGFDAIMKNTSG